MEIFIRKSFLFLLPILIGLGVMEYYQRVLPNDYTAKKHALESRADSLDFIILGSSHAYMGLNPAWISGKGVNMAFTAQTLYFDDYLLDRYIGQLPRLKTVILPISYPTYGAEAYLLPGDYNRSNYYAVFYGARGQSNPMQAKYYSATALFSIKESVDRLMDYYLRDSSLVEYDANGWFEATYSRNLKDNAKNSGTFHDRFFKEEVESANIGYLEHMARICKQHKVNLVLVSTPMHPYYMEVVKASRYQRMVSITDSIANKWEIPYFNYTFDKGYTDSDFFDSNHLNPSGAKRFSHRIDSLISREDVSTIQE